MGNRNGGCRSCGCRKNDCDCDCNECGRGRNGNLVRTGPGTPDFFRFQTVNGQSCDCDDNDDDSHSHKHHVEIGPLTTQVDVCGNKDVTLELPDCPRFGRAPLVINNTGMGTVTLVSDDADIVGQNSDGQVFIGPESAALVTFTSCGKCGEWQVLLGSQTIDGDGPCACVAVANLAQLAALNTCNGNSGNPSNSFPQFTRAFVATLDQYFELDRTSTAIPDGITIIAAKCSGSTTGNWLRIETFSKFWSQQINWFIDPANGNDENKGDTPATALKNVAEACRRLHQIQASIPYTFNLLGSSNPNDRFRPSYIFESNDETLVPPVPPATSTTGVENLVNIILSGVDANLQPPVPGGTGTTGAFTPTNGALNAQATIDLGQPVDGFVGKYINIPSLGAIAGIGKATVPGGNIAQITEFRTLANVAVTSGLSGVPYTIVSMTAWNGPLNQMGMSQGRLQVQNLLFPAPAAPPAAQETIATRYQTTTFARCIFQRPFDVSTFSGLGINSCIFDYTTAPAFLQNGVGGTVIFLQLNAAVNMGSDLLLNTDLRLVNGTRNRMTSCYFQGSRVSTVTSSTTVSYNANVNSGTSVAEITLFGSGIGVFDWPVAAPSGSFRLDAGVTLADNSQLNAPGPTPPATVGTDVYGTNPSQPNSVGLRVSGSSKFLWLTPGATQPHITGVLADVQLEDNGTTVGVGTLLQDLEQLAPGPLPAKVQLIRWADWAAAVNPGVSGFNRRVLHYGTGATIAQVTS